MYKKELKHMPYDPLDEKDTENQTVGCRCYNPEICMNNGNVTCAFYSNDGICRTPSIKWKKIYNELKSKKI